MNPDELKQEISGIRTWRRSDERVPHKPLLILYALGRFARGEPREMYHEDVKEDLRKLPVDFGQYRHTYSLEDELPSL